MPSSPDLVVPNLSITSRTTGPRKLFWAGLMASLILLAGCLSRDYEEKYSNALVRYRTASEFSRLWPQPAALSGDSVRMRYPRVFTTQINPGEDTFGTRAIPPFLADFPDFRVAYEAVIDRGGTKTAAVLTVGVVPAAAKTRELIETDILDQVRKEDSFAAAQWSKARELTDFTGAVKRWDVLELKGPQPFAVKVGDKQEMKTTPGICEIWVSAEPRQDFCLILVWRVPDELSAEVPLAELAPLTARTLIVEAPQEAAPAEPAAQP